jgi:hypothetical protein
VINAGCNNMDRLVGTEVCVGAPGRPYVAPGSQTLAPITPTTVAPKPTGNYLYAHNDRACTNHVQLTDMAEGTNDNCGQFYQVVSGDYCNLITIKYGISLADFVFLNPTINEK